MTAISPFQGSTSNNLGEMSVRINDVPIEINGTSVFWWRTMGALNFVPKVGNGEIQSLRC